MTQRRQLSDDERALWSGFARSITPLPTGKSAKASAASSAKQSDAAAAPSPRAKPRQAVPREAAPAAARLPPLEALDRRLKQRVARGREPIDARIDLHGMTQVQAHAALLRFLRRAQGDGARIGLVVTGKGSERRGDANERGVLRRQVPMWLALPEFRSLIVGFEDAHVGHGGQGALYVRLRRAR